MTNVAGSADNWRRRLATRALDEARRFLLMFLYLWVLLGIFVLHERIVLRSRGIDVVWDGFAFLNALVLAKVMLLAEDFDLGRWMPRRPLIFPILFDAAVLSVLFVAFHFAEEKVIALIRRNAEAPSEAIGGGGVAGVLAVAAILFVALIPFFAFRHVSRELGESRLQAMLLKSDYT
jgi:carbon starvation protein CstA